MTLYGCTCGGCTDCLIAQGYVVCWTTGCRGLAEANSEFCLDCIERFEREQEEEESA